MQTQPSGPCDDHLAWPSTFNWTKKNQFYKYELNMKQLERLRWPSHNPRVCCKNICNKKEKYQENRLQPWPRRRQQKRFMISSWAINSVEGKKDLESFANLLLFCVWFIINLMISLCPSCTSLHITSHKMTSPTLQFVAPENRVALLRRSEFLERRLGRLRAALVVLDVLDVRRLLFFLLAFVGTVVEFPTRRIAWVNARG